EKILNEELSSYTDANIICIGDYNLEQRANLEQDVLNNHAKYGLAEVNLHTKTFIHNEKSSTPDKVFANCPVITDIKTIENINHKLIVALLPKAQKCEPPKYKINLIKNSDIRNMITKKIEQYTERSINILKFLNVNNKCLLLHSILIKSMRRIERRERLHDRSNPIIQHVRKLRDKARKTNAKEYDEFRREVKKLAKRFDNSSLPRTNLRYTSLQASELEKHTKNIRELLDSFILDGNIKETEKTIKEIKNFYGKTNMKHNYNQQDMITSFTLAEVSAMIKNLKSGKSGGITGIRNEFLKICPENFINELTNLYNAILDTQQIPDSWKRHKIKPIPKDKDNFRPIALIEQTRKLFEKLLLTKIDIKLHRQQTGFRAKHSTINHALALDTILRHGNGKYICVTLDIKKAYDSVFRKNLYKKLLRQQNFSIKDTTLIANLIENNSYTICQKNTGNIKFKTAALGLPQGSIISPILFNIFINDIISYIPKKYRYHIFLYADDIVIYSTCMVALNTIIDGLCKHAAHNRYLFNPKKCFYNATKDLNIFIYGKKIEKQNPLKYLGFYFNNRCADTNETLKTIRKKSIKAAVITNRAFKRSEFNSFHNLPQLKLRAYNMYVRPHIDYHAVLLGCNTTFNTAADRIQKGVIKFMYNIYYRTPSKIIYALFPIESIPQRVERLRYSLGERILQMKKTIIRFAFLRLFSKNIRNIKNGIKTIRKKFPNMDAKERFKKLNKENLRVNFTIFQEIELLKKYNFQNSNKANFERITRILSPFRKEKEISEILNLFQMANIARP
ncbi:reverse transcriptase, partial [Hamiltosporidium tvaerminnensis]